nr:hypothetical protein [Tanacetum cinerariifolium]
MSEEMLQARENLIMSIQTFLKKFNRISFRETPKVLTQAWDKFFEMQNAQPKDTHELLCKLLEDVQIINEELAEYINSSSWNHPAFYDDDDDEYSIQVCEKSPIAIAPVLPTEEPENSLSITSDSELVSLEEVKDEILRAKLLNIHLLIAKIKLLNNNPTPNCVLKSPSLSFLSYSDNSLHEFETFSDHTEETSSGSATTHADNSLLEYDSFLFEIEPDQGELSSIAAKAILGEPRVYVPNVLPTHPTLYQDSDFSSSDKSIGTGLEVSFPFGTRNKIFDPRILIEVQSERLLSRAEFSISFIRDPLYPVFKPGILSYLLVSHRDKTTFDFSENPMMMFGGDIPLLDFSYLYFYPP